MNYFPYTIDNHVYVVSPPPPPPNTAALLGCSLNSQHSLQGPVVPGQVILQSAPSIVTLICDFLVLWNFSLLCSGPVPQPIQRPGNSSFFS